jgi:hypothetical protein
MAATGDLGLLQALQQRQQCLAAPRCLAQLQLAAPGLVLRAVWRYGPLQSQMFTPCAAATRLHWQQHKGEELQLQQLQRERQRQQQHQ